MSIWVGTNKLSTKNNAYNFVSIVKTQTIYVDTNNVWKRNDPVPTYDVLFLFQGAGLPHDQQYDYSISTFSLGADPLSTYDHLHISLIASYYDPSAPPGQEVVWFYFGNPDTVSSYGDTQLPAPMDYKYNLSTTGLLEITTTGSGPMGGWLHFPQMIQITGGKYN